MILYIVRLLYGLKDLRYTMCAYHIIIVINDRVICKLRVITYMLLSIVVRVTSYLYIYIYIYRCTAFNISVRIVRALPRRE